MKRQMLLDLWPYLLPLISAVLSYLAGILRNKLKMPKPITDLLQNVRVMDTIAAGIMAARTLEGATDAEKQEHVRQWAKAEIYKLVGEWLPDSAINFLIETVIVRTKGK